MDDDADDVELKRAYRSLAKECHPDYLGESGHNICVILNEARRAAAPRIRPPSFRFTRRLSFAALRSALLSSLSFA